MDLFNRIPTPTIAQRESPCSGYPYYDCCLTLSWVDPRTFRLQTGSSNYFALVKCRAPRALAPTIRAAHTPTNPRYYTITLRRHGHMLGSPTQSGLSHQNMRLGGYRPGCTHIPPTLNHTNVRELFPPATPLFHCPLEYPTPTRYH
jgi:hypothetical protein